jgi:glycosyltransferase involved in cell wall biosynthesis
MKILWLSHLVPYPPKGGVLQRSFNLLLEVCRNNEVYLVAFNQKPLLPTERDLENAASALRKYCHGIKVVPMPSYKDLFSRYSLILKSLFTKKPYTVNWNRCSEMEKILIKTIDEFNPDLIHYDTIGMAEYFQYNTPILQALNHHNIESAMMFRRATKERNVLKKVYFYQEAKKIERYEKAMCKLFHSNLTVSDEDGLTLKKIDPEIKTEVIPNGVDTSYFSSGADTSDGETLIFAGGMNWYPNLDAMLYFADEIWPRLKERRATIKMIIIGQSPPRRLRKLSEEDRNFVVTGFVDDVRPYFGQASIYVCPIRDGGGTRLKILDALSSGLPIVATSVAAEGIKVTPRKNIIIANTSEEFIKEILHLIEDQELRRQLSAEGRCLAEKEYSWSIIGERLNKLYNSLKN